MRVKRRMCPEDNKTVKTAYIDDSCRYYLSIPLIHPILISNPWWRGKEGTSEVVKIKR